MTDPTLKIDFALMTYHVKGIVLSSLLIGDRLAPHVKNDWKLTYKRMVTAAKNYEAEMNKVLGEKNTDVVEDMDALIFQIVHQILKLNEGEFESFRQHVNNWEYK